MANKHTSLDALFTDIADAIRELTGDEGTIPAVEFPNMIRNRLEVAPPTYLTFSSPNSFTLAVGDATKHWDGTLEYSTDTSTWTTWDGTTTLSSATSGSDNVLYLRGTGNTVITGNSSGYKWVLTGSNIKCVGNIENLLDYATVQSGANPTMAIYCYRYMFRDCTSLTQVPSFPATTLANYCYAGMFQGCTALTQAPALPATTLADSCYSNMFDGCTSLTQAPALPATTLAPYCYNGMFSGCTSLTQAPALPATTLADYCCNSMFYGCTALTQAPALPATTLAIYCYQYMFNGCTSLTQAPTLPATTLADYCYQCMFKGCIGLTQAPALPATTLATNCYRYMFRDCTALTQAPALPATMLTSKCYQYMFYGCTSLTQAPALPATTLVNNCYDSMFQGCTSLVQIPALPATKLANYCYRHMFQNCTKIKLSSTQSGEYTQTYRIPSSGNGTTATNALNDMFTSTGGTFTGTPSINTTYYLSNTNEVIGASIFVNITASNISEYFTVTNGSSYYFKGNGNVFTTNNAGVNSSTASTTLTAKQNISKISFDYSYSSEPNFDKFTLKVAGSTIENAVSGATTTKSYNGSLASGQTIEFKYAKDSSVDRNDDKCTFSNMVIKLG